jgi:hypothetical protein
MKDLFTDMEEQQVEIEHHDVLSIVKHPKGRVIIAGGDHETLAVQVAALLTEKGNQ